MSIDSDFGITGSAVPQAPERKPLKKSGNIDADFGITANKPHATTEPAPQKPAATPAASGINAFFPLIKHADKAIDHAADSAGKAIRYGHAHPWEAFQNVMSGPQRGLQALETGQDIGHAIVTPSEGPKLTNAVKKKIGLQGLEDNQLKGSDLPHKLARGTLDFGLDVLNDPMTVAPVGKGLELLGKGARAIPGVERAATAAGHAIAESPVGEKFSGIFNPDHYMRGLTPEAKAVFEQATNRAMETVRARKAAEDAIVRKHANEIRAGQLPDEVRNLFTAPKGGTIEHTIAEYFPDGIKKGTKPRDVQRALFQNRAPQFKTEAMQHLQADTPDFKGSGIFKKPDFHAGQTGTPFTTSDPKKIAEIQERLKTALEHKFDPDPNLLIRAAHGITHRGNQAFLANPFPHTLNLSSLAYGEYGVPTLAKGLVNAVRVAIGKPGSGHLAKNIAELEAGGAKSQYGNLFDELGLTRIANIPGTGGAASAANKVLIPLQRASNYAQHKVLNSTETGLRAAALDAERAKGVTGPAAMKAIHATFGTDAPNGLTRASQGLGQSFAKFHLQTAPGYVIKTLVKNPARISNQIKAQQDYNHQVNPHGPQYRSSVPGVNAARMIFDPEHYFPDSMLGPIANLRDQYGTLSALQQGKLKQALEGQKGQPSLIEQRYVPGDAIIRAMAEAIRKKRGRAHESGLQDLFSSGVGGYYGKK